MDEAPPAYNDEYNVTPQQAPPQVAQPPAFNPQAAQQPQQVVYQQQPNVVYVDQYGQPIQQQMQIQQAMQQPASTQQTVELQVQPQSTQAAAPLNINYGTPPTDDKHQWVNDDELPPDYESIIAGETSNEPKKGDGCLKACKDTPHCKAWFFTLIVLFFILCWAFCLIILESSCSCDCWSSFDTICREDDISTCDSYDLECSFPCSMTYALGWGYIGIVAGAYLLYFCEFICCSSSMKYLRNVHDQETIYQYIERLHGYPPRIWWKVECYHYETRTRTVSDGNGGTKTETYTEKVVTHRASTNYQYVSWKDVSAAMTGLNEYNLTKLTNYKMFSFANKETENDYNYKAAEFRRNNDRDTHQSFYYGVEVQEFKKKMLVEVEPGTRSKTISLSCYLISSFLLCTACFRMYFASVCGRKKYIFNKQVSIYAQ